MNSASINEGNNRYSGISGGTGHRGPEAIQGVPPVLCTTVAGPPHEHGMGLKASHLLVRQRQSRGHCVFHWASKAECKMD